MDTTLPTQEGLQPQMSEAEVALMDKYTPDGCIQFVVDGLATNNDDLINTRLIR